MGKNLAILPSCCREASQAGLLQQMHHEGPEERAASSCGSGSLGELVGIPHNWDDQTPWHETPGDVRRTFCARSPKFLVHSEKKNRPAVDLTTFPSF